MRHLIVLSVWVSCAGLAEEGEVRLREGPDRERVEANCMMCHSVDYIEMNGGILDQAGWSKTVDKMVQRFGAPISDADQELIVGYLTRYYGR